MEQNESQELSLKDIFGKVKPVLSFFTSRWLLFFIVAIIFGVLGYLRAYFEKPVYKGTITFVLSTESKASSSPLGGLAGQFLMDMGGMGGGGSLSGDVFKGTTLLDYMNSYYVIKKVLFKPFPGKDSVFANYFAKEGKMDEKWKANGRTASLFPFPASAERITPLQDSLLRELHELLTQKYLELERPSKKTSFYQASASSINEAIAVSLPGYLLEETAKLYTETQTKQARESLEMLKHEADTLGRALSGTLQNVASTIDETYNLNPAYMAQRAPARRQEVNATTLSAAYSEVLRNLELAKISLQKEKPLFQVIDFPSIPLKVVKSGRIKNGLLWAVIADILVFIFVFIRFLKMKTSKK